MTRYLAGLRYGLAFISVVHPGIAFPQEIAFEPASVRVVTAIRIPEGQSIRVDGALDELVWQTAPPATDFRQRDPDNGAEASERTEVRVVYDADRLLIGAVLYDGDPDGILANTMQRDGQFNADDRFIVTLDTFLDGRNGYIFQVNPAGAMVDGLINPSVNNDGFGFAINRSWDGIWTARVRRVDEGWIAEVEIPFRTLNFDPAAPAWGINFQRTIRRRHEHNLWTAHARNQGVTRMSHAGRLEGLTDLSQGLGLDVKPYVVGNTESAPGRGRDGIVATGDVGLDVFYNLTPALRANVSVNTDFAETEVDARQVNLTRFPLFFAEKRDFFLQGSSYFDFGREEGNQVTPFFSRRIGLDAEGRPQRIDAGVKLTGQAGAFDLGFLQVRTADGTAEPGADFTAARLRRRLFQESYVGVLYTRRADRTAAGADSHTAGVDAALRTSTFLGNKALDWSSWYLFTSTPFDVGRSSALGSRIQFPNDPFYFDLSYRELQPNYSPAVGFLERAGFRRVNPRVGYAWRFGRHPWLRAVQSEIDTEFYHDSENRPLTRAATLRPIVIAFRDNTDVFVQVVPTYERLERDFEISDGVVLPAGSEYHFTRYGIGASMPETYLVTAGGRITAGEFFSGERREYQINIGIRPRRGIAVMLEAEHNVLDLAEGSFATDVVRATANTQLSPWVSVVNNLQYDSVSQLLGWQMRFRWIQRPGNDLFFVYTHNWREFEDLGTRRFETLDNRAATKLVYTLRF